MPSIKNPKLHPFLILFFTSAISVILQMNLVKICDVLLNSSTGFFLISLGLCLFCLSGAIVLRFSSFFFKYYQQILSVLILLFCLIVSTTIPLIRIFSTFFEIYELQASMINSFILLLMLSVPFLVSGLIVLLVIQNKWAEINYVYAVDMLGLGLAVFIPRLLLPALGPEKLMFAASALFLIVNVNHFNSANNKYLRTFFYLILIFNVIFFISTDPTNFFKPQIKKFMPSQAPQGQIEYSHWDPLARIDVIDFSNTTEQIGINFRSSANTKYIFFDGGTIGTKIFKFDGNYVNLKKNYRLNTEENFTRLATVASHALKENTNAEVYLFGVGAGQEIKAALLFGARQIYANELVPSIVDLSKNEYADYNGQIFNSPKVKILVGDGRIQLSQIGHKLDIIQIFSNYLSASMATGTSAFQISYLFTVESFAEYIDKLKPAGILQINQYDSERLIKILSIAWQSLGNSKSDLNNKILIIKKNTPGDILPTLLFKKSDFTKNELTTLREIFQPAEYSIQNYDTFTESSIKISATDDSPFFPSYRTGFFNFLGLNKNSVRLFIGLFLFLMYYIYHSTSRNSSLLFSCKIYFLFLGLAYAMLQTCLIQIFLKYMDKPDLSLSLTLSGLCFGALFASLIFKKFNFFNFSKKYLYFSAFFVFLILVLFFETKNHNFLYIGEKTRIVFVWLISLLTGFFIGYGFPLGLKSFVISTDNKSQIAEAWFLNGAGVLFGSLIVSTVNLYLGFSVSLALVCFIYLSLAVIKNNLKV